MTEYLATVPPTEQTEWDGQLLSAIDRIHLEPLTRALAHVAQAGPRERKRPDGRNAALRLQAMGADGDSVVAAVLADPRLRERLDTEALTAEFGKPMASLVHSIHWLNTFKECREEFVQPPEQAEHLRRMLLAMVDDVRAVLVKLAYRLERLQLLAEESYETRRCIARETLDIYAPLANRLGLGQLKWSLEDLAFRYLEPQTYKRLAKSLEETRDERERYVQGFVNDLQVLLQAEGIDAEVYGRPKHIYSIYKKINRKNSDLKDLYDIRAVRVLVDRVATCYAVLGVVHGRWTHIPKEFDDYIANRKENGYQSLHTAVIGPEGKVVEVQIRTREMHALAEQGVAAHWRYKEGGRQDHALDRAVNSLRNLLEHRDNDEELLESFHTELFGDRVFVLTPRGDVLDLPKGSTPLDFAYSVHSQIGHRCRGAKVDGHIVPLTYVLKSGEQVEVLTAREPNPSRDWYNPNTGYLFSARTRAKVRHWFAQLDRDQHLADGRSMLEREAHRLGVPVPDLDTLVRRFHVQTQEELLLAIGRGDVRTGQLVTALQGPVVPVAPLPSGTGRKPSSWGTGHRDAIRVQGVGNLLTQFAQCCKPAPGDPVVGYITKGEGVMIHRSDCQNILNLPDSQRKRLIEADWGEKPHSYPVDIHIEAFDRQGLLRDITSTLSNEKINVLAANTRTNRDDQSVIMDLEVEIVDITQLSRTLDKLSQLPHVISAQRKR